jgi:membrane peptidoglycan carboxypeptidase
MRIAQKIEDKYTKDQILERYFHLVYLGSGATVLPMPLGYISVNPSIN